MCSDISHKAQLDNLANKMHNIISDACKSTFSIKKKPSLSPFSWSDNLKKLRDKSKWWHWLWIQAGKPLSGHIYSIMKSTRSLYHREIKRVKFEETQRRYCSLVRHAKNPNKFYQKMRIISGNNKAKFVPAINGKTGSEAANEFARDLTNFQNVTLDESAVRDLNFKLLFPTSHLISPANISDAISRLSSNKPDVNNINSSVIKLLGPQFISFLTRLVNSLLIHNHIPVILTKSTLHPILKNGKKNVSDTSSYRLIAIISVFVKILDYVTLSCSIVFLKLTIANLDTNLAILPNMLDFCFVKPFNTISIPTTKTFLPVSWMLRPLTVSIIQRPLTVSTILSFLVIYLFVVFPLYLSAFIELCMPPLPLSFSGIMLFPLVYTFVLVFCKVGFPHPSFFFAILISFIIAFVSLVSAATFVIYLLV